MEKIYKVYCEFFVRANNLKDVETFCGEDTDFVEKHIIVKEAEIQDLEHAEIYEDLTKE